MIIDRLENCDTYCGTWANLRKAFEFLKGFDAENAACGRYEIDGDRVYAMVLKSDTAPAVERKMEAHRRYIDIQYIAKGTEVIGYAPLAGLPVEQEYDSEKDIMLVTSKQDSMLRVDAGMFILLYPQDGHRPGCMADKPQSVMKVVVKVSMGK